MVTRETLYVAEYSQQQDQFHCQLLVTALQGNKKKAEEKTENDWVIIGIGSLDQVGEIIDQIRKKHRDKACSA